MGASWGMNGDGIPCIPDTLMQAAETVACNRLVHV